MKLCSESQLLPDSTLRLVVKGINCPAFKNLKSIFVNRKTGKPMIATNPKRKQIMEQITNSFVSQLVSLSQTTGNATWTVQQRLSSTAYKMPASDCWQCIPVLAVTGRKANEPEITVEITPI